MYFKKNRIFLILIDYLIFEFLLKYIENESTNILKEVIWKKN